MKNRLKSWPVFFSILLSPWLLACDDEINLNTSGAAPVLNVDAWVNNKSEPQTIKLTWTQDYFENSKLPSGVSGAKVSIQDDSGAVFYFSETTSSGSGSYTWQPGNGQVLGSPGRTYQLIVDYKGETFLASCKVGRVPKIDSLSYKYEEGQGFIQDEYRAEFWATDPVGHGDTYWIKTFKNGTFMNKASELNIAYDAGISAGSGFDGVTFVSPIRSKINPNEEDSDGRRKAPIVYGDSLYVEIHSISLAAFNYFNEVIDQTDKNGGLAELFNSTPIANVSSNLANKNPNGSGVVGFFNVARVSGTGKRLSN
jgi:hypothetical protein